MGECGGARRDGCGHAGVDQVGWVIQWWGWVVWVMQGCSVLRWSRVGHAVVGWGCVGHAVWVGHAGVGVSFQGRSGMGQVRVLILNHGVAMNLFSLQNRPGASSSFLTFFIFTEVRKLLLCESSLPKNDD